MTTVKVKFRKSAAPGKEGRVYYQVICNRTVRLLPTGYRLRPSEWNAREGMPLVQAGAAFSRRREELQAMRERIVKDKMRLSQILLDFSSRALEYTADDVAAAFRNWMGEQSFAGFMQAVIERMRRMGKVRTPQTYAAAFRSFMQFRGNRDVMLDDMDAELMQHYEAWLKARRVSLNTVSFYMRILRAAYNRAVERGLTVQRAPFKHVYTGMEKTVKRAVSIKRIRELKALPLRPGSWHDWARDMFMFSFYTRGMSFIDMACLRKTDLKNGILTYRRRKTGQQLFIKWEPCMQAVVDKYRNAATAYLLPILAEGGDEERQYDSALHRVNRKLKEISSLLGLSTGLTMYVARHSWASAAKSKRIPISVISEGMGHDSETTTRIYLAALDNAVIDRANSLILKNL